jgi:hypothetical protein
MVGDVTQSDVLAAFSSLRQHQRNGQRAPHKPLLAWSSGSTTN